LWIKSLAAICEICIICQRIHTSYSMKVIVNRLQETYTVIDSEEAPNVYDYRSSNKIIYRWKRTRASIYRRRCIPMLATLMYNQPVHVAAFRFTIRVVYSRSVISRGGLRNVYICNGWVFSSACSVHWHRLPVAGFWTTFLYCSSIQKLVLKCLTCRRNVLPSFSVTEFGCWSDFD
jgi:hypothetical protein